MGREATGILFIFIFIYLSDGLVKANVARVLCFFRLDSMFITNLTNFKINHLKIHCCKFDVCLL